MGGGIGEIKGSQVTNGTETDDFSVPIKTPPLCESRYDKWKTNYFSINPRIGPAINDMYKFHSTRINQILLSPFPFPSRSLAKEISPKIFGKILNDNPSNFWELKFGEYSNIRFSLYIIYNEKFSFRSSEKSWKKIFEKRFSEIRNTCKKRWIKRKTQN